MMSTTGKTPVSLLSETLIRRGIQPIYELQQSALGVNQGLFVYEVVAGHVVSAVGSGRSKKEAKQDAAKRALEILRSGVDVVQAPAVSHFLADVQVPTVDVISPYEAELKGNLVGKLIDICAQHNIPQPVFELIREDGPPHAKHFEFVCKVSAMVASAVGRTKQQAKQLAAHNMLLKMEQIDVVMEEVDLSSDLPNVEATIGQFKEAKNDKLPLGMKIGQGFVKDWTDEKIAFIQGFHPDNELMNGLEMLETICQELQLAFDISEVPCIGAHEHLLILAVSTTPESSFLGRGTPEKRAKHDVACQAIEYMQVMTRVHSCPG